MCAIPEALDCVIQVLQNKIKSFPYSNIKMGLKSANDGVYL